MPGYPYLREHYTGDQYMPETHYSPEEYVAGVGQLPAKMPGMDMFQDAYFWYGMIGGWAIMAAWPFLTGRRRY